MNIYMIVRLHTYLAFCVNHLLSLLSFVVILPSFCRHFLAT